MKECFHIRSYQDLSIQYVGIWSQFEHATPMTSPNMQGRLVTVHWKNVSKSIILCDATVHQRLEKDQWDISSVLVTCHQYFSCFARLNQKRVYITGMRWTSGCWIR